MANPIRITILPGDGIGPEVVGAALRVLEATGIPFEWDVQLIGQDALKQEGKLLPEKTLDAIKASRLALKGPTATPLGKGHKSLNLTLRQTFDLYANVRPVKILPGVKSVYAHLPIDLLVFRENVEGEYAVKERCVAGGVKTTFLFTEKGCERIARFAFEYAKSHNRKKMTVVTKPNIWKKSHGLFREIALEEATRHPEIVCEDVIWDAFMMKLVMDPTQFDCILMSNLVGDIVSDTCAGLVGGLGYAPGANIGDDCAIFEAVHGTAPPIVGKGIANPTAIILSGAMLLDHIGRPESAEKVRGAIEEVLREGSLITPDGCVTSIWEFTDAVISYL